MKKAQILWLSVCALLIALFNTLFFILDGNQPLLSVWISYIFIHIGYLQVLFVPSIVPKSKSAHSFLESTAAVSAVFFLVFLTIGLLFIILRLDNWILPFAVQLIILFACIIAFLTIHFTDTQIASQENRRSKSQKVLKDATITLNQAISLSDVKDKAYLQGILADIRTCPIFASEGSQSIDHNIASACDKILTAVRANDGNAIRSHGAILRQLILLRKHNQSE